MNKLEGAHESAYLLVLETLSPTITSRENYDDDRRLSRYDIVLMVH